ncbi:GNAT family N-acetyltransferase [Neobacillus terrae]|uniref:GNAT family N-acetyltransferase n=1 Tax=Neobacillus terrae TaxID=3034837 RepID=UPI00140CFD37|nr:GNAT family N-acetyltransferase [Neobacillus terrae]NHM29366.1 GNAT family N-acetyltransferase [Neobacillus terrae]
MADWYEKLTFYFPEIEMKIKGQMEQLFLDKDGIYKRDEGIDYVLIYLEKEDFIFIDYILITGSNRGKGAGSRLIDRLKRKGKPIILEVEPINSQDPDSKKRVRFYEKNGFKMARSITYQRMHIVTNELNEMDIYYWSPEKISENWIFAKMKETYIQVHTYKAKDIYGKEMQHVSEVLYLNKNILRRAE